MTPSDTPISRLERLSIEHFRGFHGKHDLALDADVVVVAGPNGYGKSSLIEAIALLLTGWHDERLSHFSRLVSRHPGDRRENLAEPGPPEPGASLTAKVQLVDSEDEREVLWRAQRASAGNDDAEQPTWSMKHSGLPQDRALSDELEAKLSAFFQERLDRLFDETASGTTLRDVLEPRPAWVETAQRAAGDAAAELDEAIPGFDQWSGRPGPALLTVLDQAIAELAPLYEKLVANAEVQWPAMPGRFGSDGDWSGFAVQVVEAASGRALAAQNRALPEALVEALVGPSGELTRQIKAAKRRTPDTVAPDIQRRITELEQRQTRLAREREAAERRFPHLADELALFSAQQAGEPDALAIFRALAGNARRWSALTDADRSTAARLADVLEQLAMVDPEQAAKSAETLETWLLPRRETRALLKRLDTELASIATEIARLRRLTDIQRLQTLGRDLRRALEDLIKPWNEERARLSFEARKDQRAAARDLLERARDALVWIADTLDRLTAPDEATMARLAQITTWVMGRFSTVPGLLPVQLVPDQGPDRRGYRILTGDGRELVQLSTGQKAQFGVALMVAQNREASTLLSHHVLLLDDVSTAYDLSNLTREALLWRQLAYGPEAPIKRQVFISSHHEDMTNQLLDLLVPPPGYRLLLVRFTDWSPEQGPSIQRYEVDNTGSRDPGGEAVRGLVQAIEHERLLWTAVKGP